MAQLMPWELDKPVEVAPPAAMPWELDAPVQAAKPAVTQPVVSQNREVFPGMNLDSAARASVTPTANIFDMAQPVDMRAQTPDEQAAGALRLGRDIANADPTGQRELASDAYLWQNVRKGAVDLLDAAVDPIVYNARMTADALSGNLDPAHVPFAQSTINSTIDQAIPAVADEDMSRFDRLQGAAVRGGTSGLIGGLLMKAANAPTYAANAGKVITGDTLAGAGANLAAQEYFDAVPEEWQQAIGPLGQIFASILGGGAGATVNSAAFGAKDWAANSLRDSAASKFGMFTDPSTPINPDTGKAYKPSEMDMAARIQQNMPTDLEKTVANIRNGVDEFGQFAQPDQMPTTGMMANDIGMSLNEKVARTKNPQRFAERDAARNDLASQKIATSVPAGAEGQDLVNTMTKQYDDTIGAARNQLETARVAQAMGADDINAQNAMLEEARRRQGERSTALDTEFRNQNTTATAEKNALYDAVPASTPINGQDMAAALDEIDATVPRAAQQGTDYANASARIRGLLEQVDPQTGEVSVRDLTYGDAKVLKTELGALRKDAVAAGRDVSQIDKLNALLSETINSVNPEAAQNYAENFAPRFRTGKAGEYSQALKRAVKTGDESSGTRPSEFGQKFLAKPEDAASLQRAIDVNGNPVTAETASEWMLGDLAKSNVLNGNGELRYDRMRQWADKNRAVIDQFPAIRRRVDAELERANRGGRLSRTLAQDVRNAEQKLNMTETDLRRSALQNAIGNNPENTIASIMGSGDPAAKMKDLIGRIGADKKASDGLKAAVRDWITGKAATTGRNVGFEDGEKFSRAALDRLFTKHEKTLAQVYTPEEMQSLRQAHKLLDVAANLDVKVTGGSDTFQNFLAAGKDSMTKRNRMLEAALKAKYGVLKGGGYFRTMRLFFDAVGSLSSKTGNVENVLTEAWFNPELASHLLTRNVKEIGTPAWNSKLNKLLAVAAGNRSAPGVEDNEEKGSTK